MFKKAEIVVPPTRYEAAVSFAEERIVAPAKEMTTAAWDSVPEEIKSIVASKAGMVALAVMLLALVVAAAFRPRSSAVEKKPASKALDDGETTAVTRDTAAAGSSISSDEEDESVASKVGDSYQEFINVLTDGESSVSVATDDAVQEATKGTAQPTGTPTSSPPATPLKKKKGASLKQQLSKRFGVGKSSGKSVAGDSLGSSVRAFLGSDSISKKMSGK
ncbi:hypothetical protein ACHAXT_003979 [Thalassiosira profunda]